VSTSSSASSSGSSSTQASSTDDDDEEDMKFEVSVAAIVLASVGIVVAFLALGILLCANPSVPSTVTQAPASQNQQTRVVKSNGAIEISSAAAV
jgi:hypothetical protein